MGDEMSRLFRERSDLRFEHEALIFPMSPEAYDALMETGSLPRESSYNGPRGALEVEPARVVGTGDRITRRVPGGAPGRTNVRSASAAGPVGLCCHPLREDIIQ